MSPEWLAAWDLFRMPITAIIVLLAIWAHGAWKARRDHRYLSTSCLHSKHDYCKKQITTADGTKKIPAQCKFCQAPCICTCHQQNHRKHHPAGPEP